MKNAIHIFTFSLSILFFSCSDDESSAELPSNPNPSDISFSDESLSQTTAELKWDAVAPIENNTIVVYDIFLEGNEIVKGNTDTDYILTELKDNTIYKGEIIARSTTEGAQGGRTKDETLKTMVYSFKTREYKNPAAPSPNVFNVSVGTIGENKATLTWEPATISDESDITYSIFLRGDEIAKDISSTSFEMNQLAQNTTYEGIIMALSSNEKSTFKSFTFTTQAAPVPVTEINLLPNSLVLRKLLNRKLVALVLPEDADNKGIIWSSSDESILTVDADGLIEVQTESAATATITATSAENSSISSSISVIIKRRLGKITVVGPERMYMAIGDIRELLVVTYNGDDPVYTWTSGENSIATVDSDGNVTAISTGTVAITATAVDDPTLTSTSVITVVADPIPVTNIEIYHFNDLDNLYPDKRLGFSARVSPENATDQRINWTSSDPNIATITDGPNMNLKGAVVRTIAEGSVTLTASSFQNDQLRDEITITIPESPVSFDRATGLYKAPPGSEVSLFGDVTLLIPHPSELNVTFGIHPEKNKMGTPIVDIFDIPYMTDPDIGDVQQFSFVAETFFMPENGEVYISGLLTGATGQAHVFIDNNEGPPISVTFDEFNPIPDN